MSTFDHTGAPPVALCHAVPCWAAQTIVLAPPTLSYCVVLRICQRRPEPSVRPSCPSPYFSHRCIEMCAATPTPLECVPDVYTFTSDTQTNAAFPERPRSYVPDPGASLHRVAANTGRLIRLLSILAMYRAATSERAGWSDSRCGWHWLGSAAGNASS